MPYSEKLIDHYKNPRNVGSLDQKDPNVGTGVVGNPDCGDVVKLQIKVNPDTKEIVDVKFKTFGCGSAIASSSLVTEYIKNQRVDNVQNNVSDKKIAQELSLPPVKFHCSVLCSSVLKSAVEDWQKKSALRKAS